MTEWISSPFLHFSFPCRATVLHQSPKQAAEAKCRSVWAVDLCSRAKDWGGVLWQRPCDYWRENFPYTLCSLPGMRYTESVLWAAFMSVTHWQLSGQERNLGILTQASFCSCRQDKHQGNHMNVSWCSDPSALVPGCSTADTITFWGLGMLSFVCSVSLELFFLVWVLFFRADKSFIFLISLNFQWKSG